MKKTYLLGALVSLACLLLGLGIFLALTAPPSSHRTENVFHGPDIVLIVMDAFRADRIGAQRNGVPLTPFLDEIRKESAWFSNAITACTWTRPSMTSLFTSNYIETHQLVYATSGENDGSEQTVLPAGATPMAVVLKRAGYGTAGIQSNGNLFPQLGFDRGFDSYRTSLDADGRLVTDWAIEELTRLSSPFFLYAHYMDPHLPYDPPQQYREMMGYSLNMLSEEERIVVEGFREYYIEHCRFMTGQTSASPFKELSEEGKDAVRALYDASIRYTDDEVRRLVEQVRKKSPGALIVILADHGEHFWDHGLLGHGLTLYDCELRVPMIFLGGSVAPGEIRRLVETIDVLPTLARMAGINKAPAWQGTDLFSDVAKPGFAKTKSHSPVWNTDLEMVIADGMKLISNGKDGSVKLFDWRKDTDEARDLAGDQPEVAEKLLGMLKAQRAENLRLRTGGGQHTHVDEETLEQLKQLGYVHSAVPGTHQEGEIK